MKFCEECGAQLEDDAVFCEECGSQVDDTPLPAPVVASKKTTKSKLPILIGAVGGVVLVAVIVIVVMFVLKKGKDEIPLVNSDATTLAGEVETTVGDDVTEPSKENVTDAPTTETPTTQVPTTEEPTTEADPLFEKFVNLNKKYRFIYAGSISDEDEILKIYKEEYNRWLSGEDYKGVLVDENGELGYEFFFGNPYGVYLFGGDGIYGDYLFFLAKRESTYVVSFTQIKNGKRKEYVNTFSDVIYVNKENVFKFPIDGDDYYTDMVVSISLYDDIYNSRCKINAYEVDVYGGRWNQADEIIQLRDIKARTFSNYSDYCDYLDTL